MSRLTINNGASGFTQWGTNADAMNANFLELYALISSGNFVLVDSLNKLPPALGGVITLQDNKAYMFVGHIDLLGARLENTTGIFAIIGTTSETSSITSTGLSGAALITARYSMPMQNISITAPSGSTAIDIDGNGTGAALDWMAVNFVNTPSVGTIKNVSNFLYERSAFLNSSGMVLDGVIGTAGAAGSLFVVPSGVGITVAPTATISRRFRIIYSAFNVASGAVGIDFSPSASTPNDSYILDSVNFSGAGTATAGVLFNDNKADFNIKGGSNSATLAHATMLNNVTATAIVTPSTPVKLAGDFTIEPASQRFSLVGNKVVCDSSLIQLYEVIDGSLI